MSDKVAIIGAGAWGRALFKVFTAKFTNIILYSRSISQFSKDIKISNDLEDIVDARYLFISIPAQEVRQFCLQVKSHINSNAIIVICSKGIEISTGNTMFEIVAKIFPKNLISVVSGPNFASEITLGLPAISSIAASNIDVASDLANTFSTNFFKLYPTDDVVSVSWYGALKNVLAIVCGMIRALHLGENCVSAAITRGAQEIALLVQEKGGRKTTIFEPACIGDLFLTCSSFTSRNTKFGADLVKKHLQQTYSDIVKNNQITVEGAHTALSLHKYYNKSNIPLLKLTYDVMSIKLKNYSILIDKINNILFVDKDYICHN